MINLNAMLAKKIKTALSLYFKSQIFLFSLNALVFWVVLTLLNQKFAILLALITAILSLIPIFGIWISAIIAFSLSLLDSGKFSSFPPLIEAFLIILVYIILNQIIDLLISPLIIAKTIKIPPLLLLLSVIVATSVLGIFGTILVLPFLILIKVLFSEKLEK